MQLTQNPIPQAHPTIHILADASKAERELGWKSWFEH